MPPEPAPFVIIGMMSLFGGIAHAPLAVMLMVAEMTGSLSLLAPAMIAVAVATAIVGDRTIYEAQLRDRSSSLHHRLKTSYPMLASISVRDALTRAPVASEDVPARTVAQGLRDTEAPGVVVIDREGRARGVVSREALDRASLHDGATPVGEMVIPVSVSADETLEDAMIAQAQGSAHIAAVVEAGSPVGITTSRAILAAYRRARESRLRRRGDGRSGAEDVTSRDADVPRSGGGTPWVP
jgi:CIC family chloride channel protein